MRGRLELQAQNAGESAFVGLDDGAEVMCDQSAQHGVGVPGVAQVTGAVEGVQARHGQVGRVADIVQPRGGFQEVGVSAENGCQAAGLGGNALDVRPAAGERILEECLGEIFSPRSQSVHAAKARQPTRDVHGRGMPSEDVLLQHQVPSSGMHAGRSRSRGGRHRGGVVLAWAYAFPAARAVQLGVQGAGCPG